MARLGIDFGTTNTVAVALDRGILTEVLHSAQTDAGTVIQPLFPSAILIEKSTGKHFYGIAADRRFNQRGTNGDYVFVPSLKRTLHEYVESRKTAALSGDGLELDVADLLRGFLQAFAESVRSSPVVSSPDESLEAVITWPANANGAQRHITRKCFREAGITVIDTLNEPTASALELADCLSARRIKKHAAGPQAVAVFDLGGGTFDASVVWLEENECRVLASVGIGNLGGDDFDSLLLDLFLQALKIPPTDLSGLTQHALRRQARAQKETISSGVTKRMYLNPLDFGLPGHPVSITVEAYYEHLRPQLRPAVEMLHRVLSEAARCEPRLGGETSILIYLVGGSSKLPLVAEMVAQAFPHARVILSDKPFASVAMGAAISASDQMHYRDIFARHFGLIRLRDHGRSECFDTIFPSGTPLPRHGEPPIEKIVYYHPRHNIGHLRYFECASLGTNGLPATGTRTWSDIRFPYDPSLPLAGSALHQEIRPTDLHASQAVCEVYRCDADGVITVELRRPACNDSRIYEVFRD